MLRTDSATDLLAAALPRLSTAPAQSRFNPMLNSKRDQVVALARLVGRERAVTKVLNEVNPELSGRRRIELALPARLMLPWTDAANQPWPGKPRHYDACGKFADGFRDDIARCLIGFPKDERVRLWQRILKAPGDALAPLLLTSANVRPSNLTGFLTCSYAWQGLVEDGTLVLEEGSLFHRTWESFADLVVRENDLDSLIKARKSALKRTGPLLDALRHQGYFS